MTCISKSQSETRIMKPVWFIIARNDHNLISYDFSLILLLIFWFILSTVSSYAF